MDLFAALCLLTPAAVSLLLIAAYAGLLRVLRRRRDGRSSCRRQHARALVATSAGLIRLCGHCDAGYVKDGQWQFSPAVEADHTLD